ncbi:MAG: hypothetical protein WD557_04130 [Dehalococcoidia bacterium]
MEYSFAEQVALHLFEIVLDAYHAFRDRPRSFWGAWTLAFATTAVLLLRRPPPVSSPRPPQRERGRG